MRVAISLFLLFSQFHYKAQRSSHEPWVPTQKLPRLLTTSASAIRKIQRLGEIHDLDVDRQVRFYLSADQTGWHAMPIFQVPFWLPLPFFN